MKIMNDTYSEQYKELYQFILEKPIPNVQKWFTKICDRIAKYMEPVGTVCIFLTALCILASIVCIFTPWKKGIWIFLMIAVCFFALMFVSFYFVGSVEKLKNKGMAFEEADRIFLEQKHPCHPAVAGYHYYRCYKEKSNLAKKRLDKLLETPELLAYFNENGLMRYENNTIPTPWKSYITEYRYFVTNHYGDKIIEPKNFELFYKSNTMMFCNQINRYDELDNWKTVKEGNLYSLVSQYHDNWWMGDTESRMLFEKYYMREEVAKGSAEEKRKWAEFYANNPSVVVIPSDSGMELLEMLDAVSKMNTEGS